MPQIVDSRMRAYYDRRAKEYDDWWLGKGVFGDRVRPGWPDEVEELVEVLRGLGPARTLDVACGTAFLTRHLRGDVVGLDQSEAMTTVAATRLPDSRVVRADAVPLPFRDNAFGMIFTSHFYGHLRAAERRTFLDEARRVAGRLVIVDSALRPDVEPEEWQERKLNDGSRHVVYKRYFSAARLRDETGGRRVLHEGRWFVAVSD